MSKRVANARGKRSSHKGYRLRLHRERGALTLQVKEQTAGWLGQWLQSLAASLRAKL